MKLDFILVSQSPRRRELLKQAGYNFIAVQVDTPEYLDPDLSPEDNAKQIAKIKVMTYLRQNPDTELPLLGADTIVVTNQNEILGKPKDRNEAISFLKKIQGTSHTVITGVCAYNKKFDELALFANKTKVYIYELSDKDIEYYIDTFQPYDKAGAYGVQDWFGLRHIYKIEGCYYNVVGFPVALFDKFFKSMQSI
jgi:septum formation protein